MKVFITGGTGFIGAPLVRRLLQRGEQVVVLARRPGRGTAERLRTAGAMVVEGDILEPESLRRGMAGANLVIHAAAFYEYGITGPARRRMRDVNVGGTRNVLALTEELRIPRTVYVSSTVAYGDSGRLERDERFERIHPFRTTYERTKAEAHAIAVDHQRKGAPLVIVAPNGVVGPNDHSVWGYTLRMYLARVLPPVGWAADTVYALVAREDVVEGIVLAAERGREGSSYFLCGEPKRTREHVEYWYRTPGAARIGVWLPSAIAAPSFSLVEPLFRWVGLPGFVSRETVRAGATNMWYSGEKARRELGWSPRSAELMWKAAIDGELELIGHRQGRGKLERIRPIEEP